MPERFGEPGGRLEEQLFERRVVVLSGPVDGARASDVAASLLALDALGDEPVELRLSAEADELDPALALIDTIDVLGVAVMATVIGTLAGTMAGVIAVCRHRAIAPHGRIVLRSPRAQLSGVASVIDEEADHFAEQLDGYFSRLSEVTGRTVDELRGDHERGRFLDAAAALAYGLVDEVLSEA